MKILISKPDSLGDQIIVAGCIQQLHAQWPDSLVVWHVRRSMEVIQSILPKVAVFAPELDQSASQEAQRLRRAHRSGVVICPLPLEPCAYWDGHTQAILDWWLDFLQAQHWDLAITALRNRVWLGDLTALASGAPRRVGLRKNNAWHSFVDALRAEYGYAEDYYTDEIGFLSHDSEYESFIKLFSAAGIDTDINSIELSYPTFSFKKLKTALFAPGVGFHDQRSWPIDKWVRLAELLENEGWNIAWIEGPGDERFYINDPIPQEKRLRFGPDDLPKLAGAIEAADAVVCNDSSYVHLAAAIGTPTLAFYGCGQRGRFIPPRGKVKVVQGQTIEAGSQWHNHCDIWASIREIPMDHTLEAFKTLVDSGDTSLVSVPIELQDPPSELQNPDTRQAFLDDFQRRFWDTWSREQAVRRAEIIHKTPQSR